MVANVGISGVPGVLGCCCSSLPVDLDDLLPRGGVNSNAPIFMRFLLTGLEGATLLIAESGVGIILPPARRWFDYHDKHGAISTKTMAGAHKLE